jgi:hypothetical protein
VGEPLKQRRKRIMMKQEFEQMVGKEVTCETFEMYEAMYMALPESVNKQAFVEMLNINAIPESEEAVARREANEQRKKAIREEIEKEQKQIASLKKYLEQDCEGLEIWLKDGDKEMISFYKNNISFWRRSIKERRNRIAELKFLLQ